MRYYTLQDDSFETVNQTPTSYLGPTREALLASDGAFVEDEVDMKPYDWMKRQMDEKHGSSPYYPIWLWQEELPFFYKGRDMKKNKEVMKSTIYTFDLPDDFAVLSCYDAWHMPLNNGYMIYGEEEYDKYMASPFEPHQSVLEDSWKEVLDLEKIKAQPDYGDADHIQACVPWLEKNWLVKKESFADWYKRERRKLYNVGTWIKNKQIPEELYR